MDILWIGLAVIAFALAVIGVVYPIVPSAPSYALAIIFIGLYAGFSYFGVAFWVTQSILLVLMIVVDIFTSYFGITRIGGSKAAVWGSMIGLIVGPFILPIIGILIGAVVGAIVGELLTGAKSMKALARIGVGSLIGFLAGVILKFILLFIGLIYVAFTLWF